MKKLFLFGVAGLLSFTTTLSYAGSLKTAVTVSTLSESNVYQGYAHVDEKYGVLYFYGETLGGPCTVVKDSNGNVLQASVSYSYFCGVNFVSVFIGDDSYFATREY